MNPKLMIWIIVYIYEIRASKKSLKILARKIIKKNSALMVKTHKSTFKKNDSNFSMIYILLIKLVFFIEF